MLCSGLVKLGLSANEHQLNQFEKFYEMVVEKNKVMNLTGITEEKEFYIKHYLDSLTCLVGFDSNQDLSDTKSIDVGTGAGFPGIPIAIMTKTEMSLLDALNKRITFLDDVIDELQLENAFTYHSRAEDMGKDVEFRESYDFCFSRAVADLRILLEYCIPFLKVGGQFVCQKGAKYKEELENAGNALEILGCEVKSIDEVQLPFTNIVRYIVNIVKISETDAKFPRRSGLPTKKPL